MKDTIVGVRQWGDGSMRDVYADPVGQYILEADGAKVYGTWVEGETFGTDVGGAACQTIVAQGSARLAGRPPKPPDARS